MYDKKKKEKLIEQEIKRLKEIYGNLADDKTSPYSGLVERSAFFRVSLKELEEDINENGYTEKFSQGDQEPYDRKRPAADLYNSYSATYLKINKQLSDLRPVEAEAKEDMFDEWRTSRDDSPAAV